MNLNKYFFDVEEQDVSLIPNIKESIKPIPNHKAIVAKVGDTQKVVSIVKSSYKLIRNRELLEPFIENLSKLRFEWEIDSSHSFCTLSRMRLQIRFPDITIQDGKSEIPLSLYVHNSYDQSEGVRLFWGAIRSICDNGMVFGTVLGSLYARHTSGFSFDRVNYEFDHITEKILKVQSRIKQLKELELEEQLMKQLQSALGKRRLQSIVDTDSLPIKSQWDLLNDITYFISHDVPKQHRAELQIKASKIFEI